MVVLAAVVAVVVISLQNQEVATFIQRALLVVTAAALLGGIALIAVALNRRVTRGRGKAPATPASPVDARTRQLRLQRIEQLTTWLREDDEFDRMVSAFITNEVRASERRQQVLSIGLGIVTLIAGWLLSLIGTPATIGRLFGQ